MLNVANVVDNRGDLMVAEHGRGKPRHGSGAPANGSCDECSRFAGQIGRVHSGKGERAAAYSSAMAGGAVDAKKDAAAAEIATAQRNGGDLLRHIVGDAADVRHGKDLGESRHVAGSGFDCRHYLAEVVLGLQVRSSNGDDSAPALTAIAVTDGAMLLEDLLSAAGRDVRRLLAPAGGNQQQRQKKRSRSETNPTRPGAAQILRLGLHALFGCRRSGRLLCRAGRSEVAMAMGLTIPSRVTRRGSAASHLSSGKAVK